MKYVNIFLIGAFLVSGCQKQEEEVDDFDQMALVEDEFDSALLAEKPLQSTQEFLIKEPASVDLEF